MQAIVAEFAGVTMDRGEKTRFAKTPLRQWVVTVDNEIVDCVAANVG